METGSEYPRPQRGAERRIPWTRFEDWCERAKTGERAGLLKEGFGVLL